MSPLQCSPVAPFAASSATSLRVLAAPPVAGLGELQDCFARAYRVRARLGPFPHRKPESPVLLAAQLRVLRPRSFVRRQPVARNLGRRTLVQIPAAHRCRRLPVRHSVAQTLAQVRGEMRSTWAEAVGENQARAATSIPNANPIPPV